MSKSLSHTKALLSALALTLLAGTAARADDTEIFFGNISVGVPANIMFILDTSGSMNRKVTTPITYDPAETYGGSCSSSYVYFKTPSGSEPNCSNASRRIPVAQFYCATATAPLASAGYFTDELANWRPGNNGNYRWRAGFDDDNYSTGGVECRDDNGVHGSGASATNLYPISNQAATSQQKGSSTPSWTPTASSACWTANSGCSSNNASYVVYSANYANYVNGGATVINSRLGIMQDAAESLLNSMTNVNVGVMRYDSDASGGMVVDPIGDIATNRSTMINNINSWKPYGNTPLSETLFEAYRYFTGGAVRFGNGSSICTAITNANDNTSGICANNATQPFNSVQSARTPAIPTGANYNSPADYSCQNNYVVYLTDGEPTSDNEADTAITSLPNFASQTGGCSAFGAGRCLAALSEYMYETDLRSDVDNTQNVTSYYIGFGDDMTPAAAALLENAAQRGGGRYETATDTTSLTSVFNTIIAEIGEQQSTLFSAPTVAVNAFNRTQTLDDLFVSVFLPSTTYRWIGNIKKYRVVNEEVRDQENIAAVDPATGFFKDSATSYWSDVQDGSVVALGGAANELPAPANRTVYTYLDTNKPDISNPPSLTPIETAITVINANSVLALGSGAPSWQNVVDWANGTDVLDEDDDGNMTEGRNAMGDPVHSEPGVVIYGSGGAGTGYETVVYVTTNDGYLHAINATAQADGSDLTTSGQELWSFIPQELLPDLQYLYSNPETTSKHYGLDGPVRLVKYDVDRDGTVEPAEGDVVMLYFSTGRNDSVRRYYALDVTDKNTPKFLWSLSSSQLPELGQTWSSPTIARVLIDDGSGQDSRQRFVLIFGGGYDPDEDGYAFLPGGNDVGAHIFMIDAKSGDLLWSAGADNANNLRHTRMTHAIPSSITVLDIDNDGYADRMYAGDMAAQVWRFDIFNGEEADDLVTGGVIASLGTKESSTTHPMSETRRFYSPPDVALIQTIGSAPFINIAIGSGYRGHPLNTQVQDRLYSLRDYDPFTPLDQGAYDALHLVLDGELMDITGELQPTIAAGAYGWKLQLNQSSGEKSLTAARTLDNILYFTTYSPPAPVVSNDPCASAVGTGSNRIYAVSVFNGAPATNRDGSGGITLSERSEDLDQGGISPGVSFLFPAEQSGDVVLMSGPEVVATCEGCRDLRKTYWRDASAE